MWKLKKGINDIICFYIGFNGASQLVHDNMTIIIMYLF